MNVLRSMTRYVALALPGFEVRMAGMEGAFERPMAAITEATPLASSPHGAGHADVTQGFSVAVFPLEAINVEASRMEASRVAALLHGAFAQGIDATLFSARTSRAHPRRVPLFDYAGVGLYEAVGDDRRAGVARVLDAAFQVIHDGGADTFTVVGDVRLSWSESVAVPAGGPLAVAVTAEPA